MWPGLPSVNLSVVLLGLPVGFLPVPLGMPPAGRRAGLALVVLFPNWCPSLGSVIGRVVWGLILFAVGEEISYLSTNVYRSVEFEE